MKIILLVLVLVLLFLLFSTCTSGYTSNRTIYIIRDHLCDQRMKDLWSKLISEFPIEDCYIIFDNTNGALDSAFQEQYKDQIIVQTVDECKKKSEYFESMYHSTHVSLCFALENISFDYAWLVESDVYFDGSIKETLKDETDDDFKATYVEDYGPGNADWMWWDTLSGDIIDTPNDKKGKSLFPVTRYSSRMVDAMRKSTETSGGFCEVYALTIAKLNDYKIGNINRDAYIPEMFTFSQTISLKNLPNNNDNKMYHKFEAK